MSLHLVHIIFGLFGAIFVLVSGFDTAGRTALTKGLLMLQTYMISPPTYEPATLFYARRVSIVWLPYDCRHDVGAIVYSQPIKSKLS